MELQKVAPSTPISDDGLGSAVTLAPLSSNPVDNMRTTLKSFFESSTFSDITVRTEDQQFEAHKIVLCGQSRFFARLLNGGWKETVTNTISLKGDDPRAVEAMMNFMYELDYDGSGSHHGRVSPMLFHVKVYTVADKYDVPALKHQANERFEAAIETGWNMDDFPHVVADVYSTSHAKDRNLRDAVVRLSYEHINDLLKKPIFIRILEEIPTFAADVTRQLANLASHTYRCPNCGKTWDTTGLDGSYYYCPHCGSHRSNWASYEVPR